MGDLGEIVRAVEGEYLSARTTTRFQRKALRAIGRCRTEAMGYLPVTCGGCGVEFPLFRSCRNRHCPQCQAQARADWLEERGRELLPVPYFHVVFTVPALLNGLALHYPAVVYAAMLRAAGNALLDVGWSKLRARLGVWRSCTRGDRTYRCIRTFIVSFPEEGSRATAEGGLL